MERRTKIGIAVAVALVAIALLIWLLMSLMAKRPAAPGDVPDVTTLDQIDEDFGLPTQPISPADNVPGVVVGVSETDASNSSIGLAQVARVVAERYGSYSTHGNYENLEALLVSMSKKFATETKKLIDEKRQEPVGSYFGVTTRVLSVDVTEVKDGETAKAKVMTQRQPSNGPIYYQDIEIGFVWETNEWKVSSMEWAEATK